MFEKLQEVEKRYEDLNELVCKPEIVADLEEYTKLMKEIKILLYFLTAGGQLNRLRLILQTLMLSCFKIIQALNLSA